MELNWAQIVNIKLISAMTLKNSDAPKIDARLLSKMSLVSTNAPSTESLKHIFGTGHLYFSVPFLPFRTFLLYFFQFLTFTLSVTLMRVTKLSIRFQQVDLLQTIQISAVLFWSIFVEFFHVFLI